MFKNMKVLKEWEKLIDERMANPITAKEIELWSDFLSPVPLCDTKHMIDEEGMPSEEWLRLREHGPFWNDPSNPGYLPFTFGGSTVSSFTNTGGSDVGCSAWTSAQDTYRSKRGIPTKYDPQENTTAMRAGHILEDTVARLAQEVPGYKNLVIEEDTTFYQHPILPFIVINIDKIVEVEGMSGKGIGEVKTTSMFNFEVHKAWREGVIPPDYEVQIRIYMSVMNLFYGLFMVFWGVPDGQANVLIERDFHIEADILNACVRMAHYIVKGIEPDWSKIHSDELAIKSLYKAYGREGNGEEISMSEESVQDVKRYMELTKEIKDVKDSTKPMEKERKAIEARLLTELKEATKSSYVDDQGNVYFFKKELKISERVNSAAVKKLAKEDEDFKHLVKTSESHSVKIDSLEVDE